MFKILGFVVLSIGLSVVGLSASEVQKVEASKDSNKSVVNSTKEKTPNNRKYDVVNDIVSGLMWQDDNASKYIKLTWKDAVKECENLSLAGKSDWKLPSLKELKYIYSTKPTGDNKFQNLNSGYYWTTNAHPKDKEFALIVFTDGSIHWYNKKVRTYVKCVRGKDLTSRDDNKSKNKI